MKPTILLFNFTDKTRYNSVIKAILPLKIKIKKVDREDYLQPIGYLAGKKDIDPAVEKYEGPELADEMLLISDLTDMKLNQLLLSLKKSSVRIKLKAVLTQNNEKWNPIQLYEELIKEHEALNK
ncbi:DUF3783 domain-containing protein [Clostridium ljungdahlii]|uniref:DUF3783 domain-containing protein n=1 Tax=Clostridium ljungdahlii (strain ATCC 55383 / DSM 13528 / PETC) TaxID=748727 RepID=D8GSU2_CLOLD|nr:DUF3783 domain-containing protein [Clostridium ljungdahlii]ADK14512.1 hypothetical protein CLJU_c14440 [Clostridium ljungdahlii DSM 13528]OAA88069.1 hypothetical protein WX45_02936 [Clostridium ljungdahlii DSM 13528]